MIFFWRRIVCSCALAFGCGTWLILDRLGWIYYVLFPLLGVTLLFGGPFLFMAAAEADQHARQRHRDKRALSRLDDMKNGKLNFFLYLRPFASTGGVQIVRSVSEQIRGRASYLIRDPRVNILDTRTVDIRWDDLETLLARYLERYGSLIGLGRPGENVGAGRIAPNDEDWQEMVRGLAVNARLLFLLPSMDDGTRWEMDLVFAQPILLRKSIIIVPGTGHIDDYLRHAEPPGPRHPPGLRGNELQWHNDQIDMRKMLDVQRRDPDLGRSVYSYPAAAPRHAWNIGARPDPARTSDELRMGAIECLRALGAHDAVAQAERSPTGTLLTLGPQLEVQASYPFRGYMGISLNQKAVGDKYRLDLNYLKWTLDVIIREGQGSHGL
jgi:hypothetical protein